METLSDKKVKIRKDRQCFSCLRITKKGDEMFVSSIADSGSLYSLYRCPTCDKLLTNHSEVFFDGDGFPERCVADILHEYKCDTPEQLLIIFKG